MDRGHARPQRVATEPLLAVCLSVCLPVRLSVTSVRPSSLTTSCGPGTCPPTTCGNRTSLSCLSVCLSVCLPVRLSVTSVRLSSLTTSCGPGTCPPTTCGNRTSLSCLSVCLSACPSECDVRPSVQFDYIMWTGDMPAHNVWQQNLS